MKEVPSRTSARVKAVAALNETKKASKSGTAPAAALKKQKPAPEESDAIFLQLALVAKQLLFKGDIKNIRTSIEKYHAKQESMKEFVYLFETHLNFMWHQYAPTLSYVERNYESAAINANKYGNTTVKYDGAPKRQKCRVILGGVDRYMALKPFVKETATGIVEQPDHRFPIVQSACAPIYVTPHVYIRDYRFTIHSAMIPISPKTLPIRTIVAQVNRAMFESPFDFKVHPLRFVHSEPQNNCICYLCGKHIAADNELDHIVPPVVAFVLGVINSPLNYAPTHGSCNGPKNDGMPLYYVKDARVAAYLRDAFKTSGVLSEMSKKENALLFAALQKIKEGELLIQRSGRVASNIVTLRNEVMGMIGNLNLGSKAVAEGGSPSAPAAAAAPLAPVASFRSRAQQQVARRSLASAVPSSKRSLAYFNKALVEMLRVPATSLSDAYRMMLYQDVRDFMQAVVDSEGTSGTSASVSVNNSSPSSRTGSKMSGGNPETFERSISGFLKHFEKHIRQPEIWSKADRVDFIKFRFKQMYAFSNKYWAVSIQQGVIPSMSYESFLEHRINSIVQYIANAYTNDDHLAQ